jgi:hypothetical protein
MATVPTDEGAGIALPIEKQQDARPAADRVPDGPNERLTQHRAATMTA